MMSSSTAELRAELAWLRGRYDDGVPPPLILDVIRKLEIDLTWREHAKLADPRQSVDT
jgi:hypothetical protein